MKISHITNSKCPCCKKYGLPFYKTNYKYNPVVTCKFCGKKFKVNRALSLTVIILLAFSVVVGFKKVNDYIFNFPEWTIYFIGLALWHVFEYFAPLEEYEDDD